MFEIDDLVVVAEGGFTGKVGVVVDTEEMEDGCYVQLIGEEDVIYFENDELEFATNMDAFEAYLMDALDNEMPWMYVLMEMPNTNDEEIIVNPITNFEDKLAYYKKQYDNELKHRYVEGLRITGYGFCGSLAEIEEHINARFDDGEDDIELVEEEPKFKVGDKIVVVNDLDYPERNGMTGTITKIVEDNSGYNYQTDMRISFTQVMCLKDEEIALVDESEIVVGDKVVISGVTDSYAKYNGKTGDVFEKYEKAKWNYGVKIDGAIYVFGKGELIKIK